MKKKSLIHHTLLWFLVCTAALFVLTLPLFYLLTKHFYAEDLMEVIQAVEHGEAIPSLDMERDIMAGVMIQFVLTFLLLSVALFVTVRFVTGHLWRPFDDTLRKAEQFNLAQSDVPDFAHTDIVEFSRLNDSLGLLMRRNKETWRIQKEFTENASHELQTPLAVARGKLDLLMQCHLSGEQLRLVEELYQLNTRMGHLNRNLLMLAKIENSQYGRKEPVPLIGFIGRLLPSYELLAGNCRIALDGAVGPDVTVDANPTLLECMINNLVVNAIRHTARGEIHICVEGSSALVVSNTANGAPLDSEGIFRRFHAGDSRSGTGLGLAIVKAICDFHGWVVEYRFSEGSHVFTVSWVMTDPAASSLKKT